MTVEMTRDEYWQIVEAIGWRQLIEDKADKPYEEGKKRALELLPTEEHMLAFRQHHGAVTGELSRSIESWEQRNDTRLPVGDDGFSDLTAMIVGLGKNVWEETVKAPKLAMKRANARYGTVEGYVESFAYCIPWNDDYAPIEQKLEVARWGLDHWIERAAGPDAPSYAAREVATRAQEVAELEAQLAGVETTPEKVAELVRQETIKAREAEYEALQEQIRELQRRAVRVSNELEKLVFDHA